MNLESFCQLSSAEAFSYAGRQLLEKRWNWKQYSAAMKAWEVEEAKRVELSEEPQMEQISFGYKEN